VVVDAAIVQDSHVAKPGNEFVAYCVELLETLGPARARRMFGGHGLYVDDLFVAIVADDRLYLKVDAATRPEFEAAACEPFRYDAKGKAISLGYFSAPDEAIESPHGMRAWGRLALDAALRAKAATRPAAKPSTPRARAATPAKRRSKARRDAG
jgi:DNA transformation protein and related proteins